MSREILFRGKRVANGEWVYGYFVKGVTRHCIFKSLAESQICDVIPETVGQYVGLKDKNGKKIFEGDIIKVHWIYFNSGTKEDVFYEVIWHKDWNGWGLRNLKPTQCCYLDLANKAGEIIGNIHDNPEL